MNEDTAKKPGLGSSAQRRIHRRRSVQSLAVAAACRTFVKNAVRIWALQPNLNWPSPLPIVSRRCNGFADKAIRPAA